MKLFMILLFWNEYGIAKEKTRENKKIKADGKKIMMNGGK